MLRNCLRFLALFFFLAIPVRADQIILPSGTVVEGQIIEETDEFYKIDNSGVAITFYKDEIEKAVRASAPQPEVSPLASEEKVATEIEKEQVREPAVNETVKGKKVTASVREFVDHKKAPADVYHAYLDAVARDDIDGMLGFLDPQTAPNEEMIQRYRAEWDQVKAMHPVEIEVQQERIFGEEEGQRAVVAAYGDIPGLGGPSRGIIKFVKRFGEWKIRSADWKPKSAARIYDQYERQGGGVDTRESVKYGVISGTVSLPSNFSAQGNLFVSFFLPGNKGNTEAEAYSQFFPASQVISTRVPFRIEKVPPGEYEGEAIWDIALPFCPDKSGEVRCFSFGRDLRGEARQKVLVRGGEEVSIDIFIR